MEKMTIEAAIKLVKSQGEKDNYVTIEFSYNIKIVLKWKPAMLFLSSLQNVEVYEENYAKPGEFIGLGKDTMKVHFWSAQDYEDRKIAALLQVTLNDFYSLREGNLTEKDSP